VLEHVELDGHQHLFRFYEKPEDWRSANALAGLYSSLPGVFDVDKIRPALETTKTYWELNAIADNWK
jgi:dTDP-glucose pyrophosphorylase